MKVAASQARHLEEVALPRLLAIAADAQDRAVLQDALEAEAYEIVFSLRPFPGRRLDNDIA